MHSTIPEEAWSSSSASQIQFPAESEDEISNLTPPVRLSQEEVSEGLVDFSEVQRLIFQRLGDRLLLKPRKYLSPFVIRKSRPDVPLAKAIALRRKIAADDELKWYARALYFSFMLNFVIVLSSCKLNALYVAISMMALYDCNFCIFFLICCS